MFKKLQIYFILIAIPFIMVLGGAVIFFDGIRATIIRNPHPQINYTIFVIIFFGGLFILANSVRLIREARILSLFTRALHDGTAPDALQEMTGRFTGDLACLLQMVASSGNRAISHQEQAALEHELANARARLNRRNALPQYLTGLLVGMGLLGTFIGLLSTLNDIAVLISSFTDLDMTNVNTIQVFAIMIERMKAPMSSMSIAFSASLFGLLGSIILGLMMVGIRRLEGDVFSVLSSEVARHIENALSYGSSNAGGRVMAGARQMTGASTAGGFGEDDGPYGDIAGVLEKSFGELATGLADDARKSHKLQALQVNEQKKLVDAITGSLEKGNREVISRFSELTEHIIADAKQSSSQMNDLVANLSASLQQLNNSIKTVEESNSELVSHISALTKHVAEDAKGSREQREGMQQALAGQLGAISETIRETNGKLSSQIIEMMVSMSGDAKATQKRLEILLGARAESKGGGMAHGKDVRQ